MEYILKHTHTQNKYIRHDFMDFLITLSVKPMISSKKKYFNQTFAEKGWSCFSFVCGK